MFRALHEIYGQHNRPTELTIRNLLQKFESNGSVCDVKNPTHHKHLITLKSQHYSRQRLNKCWFM